MSGSTWQSSVAAALVVALGFALPAFSQVTKVESHDGSVNMLVEVVDFDDEKIRVLSPVGEFTFGRDRVTCTGPGCPPPVQAAPDTSVTLTTTVGSVEITGELLDFTGDEYVVLTAAGEYRLKSDIVTCSGAACPEARPAAAEPAAEVAAQTAPQGQNSAQTSLKSHDGSVNMLVEVVDFDDEKIRVLSPVGEFTFGRDRVTCNGPGCPPPVQAAQNSAVTLTTTVGSVEITGELLDFTGDEYVVLTATGEYRLKSNIVTCAGVACPDTEQTTAQPAAEVAAVAEVDEQAPLQRQDPDKAPTVSLTTKVGAYEVTGKLVEFTGTEYVLLTPTGEYRLKTHRVNCAGDGCPDLTAAVASPATEAAAPAVESRPQPSPDTPVTLTTKVGAIEITGELLDFTGAEYVLLTPTGEYRLLAGTVTCAGAACPQDGTPGVSVAAASQDPAPGLPDFDPATAQVRLAGSDTVGLGLLPSLWKGYADWRGLRHELVQLSDTETVSRYIDGTGRVRETHYAEATDPNRPFAALIDRSAEFGMAARAPTSAEARALQSAGADDPMNPENNTVIAIESIAMIVHPDNPVNALTLDQIAGIYRGDVTNWAQVGGLNAPITPLSRNDASGTREVFQTAVSGGARFVEGRGTRYPEGGNNGMRQAVLETPGAIGYVSFDAAAGAKRLNLSSTCGLTSVASSFSVKTEEYPLVRRHYLFSRPDNLTREAQSFIDYVRSPQAEAAIAASDLVNFSVEVQPASVAQDRYEAVRRGRYSEAERRVARALVGDLRSWQRLSTTLRFATGSSRLGTKEIADVKRLIAYLGEQPAGTQVAIVGFADSVGDFQANLRLSSARAALVARTLEAEGARALTGIEFTTKAFGELAPAACNTSANGRRINRRVEVWIRR